MGGIKMSKFKEVPRCPYCGAKMRLEDSEDVLFGLFADEEKMYWYQCNAPSCGIHSPANHTKVGAYKAAMKRYEKPNRVLTLEEVMADAYAEDWSFELIEKKNHIYQCYHIYQCCPLDVTAESIIFVAAGIGIKDGIYMKKSEYGVTWRCWLREPTREEMDETPWEAKHNEH